MKKKPEEKKAEMLVFHIEDYGLTITYDPVAWLEYDLKRFILKKLEEGLSPEKCFEPEIKKGMLKIKRRKA